MDHKGVRKKLALLLLSPLEWSLLLGLPFTCNAGIHMFTLFNASAPSWNLLLFALLEVVLVSWVYGVDRFLDNMEEMNIKLNPVIRRFWWFSWKIITPVILTLLLLSCWQEFGQISYKGEVYPVWVQILGYLITGHRSIILINLSKIYYRLHSDSSASGWYSRGCQTSQ